MIPKAPAHDRTYLISVTCEIYQPENSTLVHRGLVYKVLRRESNSALLQQMQQQRGEAWQVVREPELFMNGPFEQFENRIRELYEAEPIARDATFELKYDEFTDQVSKQYFDIHGFSADNVPWSGLAKHYREGRPVNQRIWREKYKINARGRTGFSEYAYKGKEDTALDRSLGSFSPEELAAAERAAEALDRAMRSK